MSTDNAAEVLRDIATLQPGIAQLAFGPDRAKSLTSLSYAGEVIDSFGKSDRQPADTQWLADGWQRASQEPIVQSIYLNRWWSEIGSPMVRAMQARNWTHGKTLAALARMRNTSRTAANYILEQPSSLAEWQALEQGLIKYGSKSLNQAVAEWPELNVNHATVPWPDPADLGSRILASPGLFDWVAEVFRAGAPPARSGLAALAVGAVLVGGLIFAIASYRSPKPNRKKRKRKKKRGWFG
jgi:hypothetical protein